MMKRLMTAALLAAGLASSLSGCVGLVAAGAAGGALVASDRRTSGAYVDDQGIELKSGEQIASQLPSSHVNRTSFNRAVLLTGQVPSEEAKQKAELIVRGIPNVRRVFNYLTVAPASGFSDRSNDTWITSKTRARLLQGKGFNPNDVKVVTEGGVAYMLGLVTQAEGDAATRIVSETAGVQKVVTLYEFISEVAPAK
ncbi:BON domain-containing protein [Chromobacterium sp. IIBBL 290-4]|uniref:BON domain-containing protein n=1 Tax=Chromobacterium sp. IIBBL 290-4 TaxID=2953890 RepID=UPI0020B8A601|nr:BON domain-containing protein [Chromobacterium sp. IIBBL 290-4]UTH76363.1 BON domain-containing protein [Chromobacterium sp. IIBBL 290-4]